MQVVRVPASTGWRWMAEGFRMLRRQPLSLFGTAAGYVLTLTLAGLVPLIGPFAIPLLIPILTVGFIHAARQIDAGRRPTPMMLFDGFRAANRRSLRPLVMLGIVNAVLTGLAMGAALVADGGALLRAMTGALDPSDPSIEDGSITYALLVFAALSVPIQMVMWYSPLFVAWHGRRPLEAVFFSLIAFWRNKAAFLVYGMSWLLVLFALMIVFLLLRAALPSQALGLVFAPGNPFSPVTLLLIAALYASFWPSYRDVVRDGPDEGEAPAAPDAR